jgi:hypothetical protein
MQGIIDLRTILIFTSITVSVGLEYIGVRTTSRLTRAKIVTLATIMMVVYGVLILSHVENLWLSNVSIILVSVGTSSVLGILLSHEVSIITFLVVSSITDIISFFRGITAAINAQHLNGGASFLRYLAITLSINGSTQWIVGIGDLVIIGTAAFALKRLGYTDLESFLIPLSGLLAGVIFALVINRGIPAIPFIAGSTILYLTQKKGIRGNPA